MTSPLAEPTDGDLPLTEVELSIAERSILVALGRRSINSGTATGRRFRTFDWYWRIGLVVCLAIALGFIPYGGDAPIWWASRPPEPYVHDAYVSGVPGYFYSPAFAQILAPLTSVVSEPLFVALWTAALFAALWILADRWALVALLLVPVMLELYTGNIHLLLGVAAVFGLRYPVLWSFPLLTKVTPGIGLLWFVVRGEWRNLAIALGATGAIVAVSFALAPEMWPRWIGLLLSNAGADVAFAHVGVPLAIRFPLAAALIVWGARTDRPWTVPVGCMLALPVLWLNGLAMLAATVRLGLHGAAVDDRRAARPVSAFQPSTHATPE